MKGRVAIFLLILAAGLVGTAPARAITIGSQLAGANNIGVGCLGLTRCTLAQTSPDAEYTSPVNGTIAVWRVKIQAPAGEQLNLRVLRPGSVAGTFTGAGTSAPVTTPSSGGPILTFPTSLPIHAGDRIGIDAYQDVMNMATADVPGTMSNWAPVLGDGGTARPPDHGYTAELMLNADVAVDNSVSLSRVRRGTGRFGFLGEISLPNPGTLVIQSPRGDNPLLKPSRLTLGAGPQTVALRLTKRARNRLTARGKVRPRIEFEFMPNLGGPGSTLVQPKLKLKPKNR